MKILLGYEVDTGKEVYLEDGHTVVTGMTQLSGKTTALEALVERGEITAVTFLTKRGESGFRNQREIQPYFKEQKLGARGPRKHALIDWQYVSAILEAVMSEKMKLERSFIINACKGAHSLEQVYKNIQRMKEETRRGFDESVYTNLEAYFEIILPQIRKYKFADKLRVKKGFNVLNLIGMENEMQQLVIESVLSYVLKNFTDTIVVIPEAHKFIPQGLKTPVKQTALRFIREGAALRNFMWIDTQETTSVDKAILKQCSNWIMGYQQEKNEVANVRENIGRRKIKPSDIMNLKLGHFIASLQQKIYHVYVLPSGVLPQIGIDVAMGRTDVQSVKRGLIEAMEVGEVEKVQWVESHPEEGSEEPEVHLYVDSQQIGVLERKIEGLEETIENMEKLEKGYMLGIDDLQRKRIEQKSTIGSLSKEVEDHKKRIGELEEENFEQGVKFEEEMAPYRALSLLLRQIIGPGITLEEYEEHIKTAVDKALLNVPKARRRRAPPGDSTGIAWIDIWMPKLGGAEQKILTFMASRFPTMMTKSEVAIGCGLTAKGGYFNAAFNMLKKNKLIIPVDDRNYKLAENPP